MRRSSFEIYEDCLKFVTLNPDCKQTQIMAKCNLTHGQVVPLIKWALYHNHLRGYKTFRIHQVGLDFLTSYARLEKFKEFQKDLDFHNVEFMKKRTIDSNDEFCDFNMYVNLQDSRA